MSKLYFIYAKKKKDPTRLAMFFALLRQAAWHRYGAPLFFRKMVPRYTKCGVMQWKWSTIIWAIMLWF